MPSVCPIQEHHKDVIPLILLSLDSPSSIFACSLTCKEWNAIIHQDSFRQQYFEKHWEGLSSLGNLSWEQLIRERVQLNVGKLSLDIQFRIHE